MRYLALNCGSADRYDSYFINKYCDSHNSISHKVIFYIYEIDSITSNFSHKQRHDAPMIACIYIDKLLIQAIKITNIKLVRF